MLLTYAYDERHKNCEHNVLAEFLLRSLLMQYCEVITTTDYYLNTSFLFVER